MHVMIMAGGAGTRFWPLSRRHRPKQLLSLFGDRPMIAETVERFDGLVEPDAVWVVTNAALAEPIREAVPALPAGNVLLEPVGRNTAPCIGMAAMAVRAKAGAETVLAVFPADHFIRDLDGFRRTVETAAKAAAEPGVIVTIGIEPTRPETGYGYIRRAASDETAAPVDAFVEKPDRETALSYLADGNYLWNAGMFFARVDAMLDEMARQLPALRAQLDEVDAALQAGDDDALAAVFERIASISIDYGVMEGAENVRVVPASFGWSDVGHWDALPDVADTDEDGNVTMGDVVAIDCKNSVLIGHDARVLAAVGLDHLVVVDSEDAVLVAPRHRVQQVRDIVASLRKRSGTLT